MPTEPTQTHGEPPVWHAMTPEQVMHLLAAKPDGLTETEVTRRLMRCGENRLMPGKGVSPVIRFLLQFHNILIYMLLAAAAITAALGRWVDSAVILGVVIINALIGFIQEGKAEKALAAIRKLLSSTAMVIRDGQRRPVFSVQLVPGDIVLLQSGDKVPADLRLLSSKNLRIEEAALTGESEAVDKSVNAVDTTATIGDRFCMAYSSTLVVYGQGSGVVVATGRYTEIGRISEMIVHVDRLTSPLLRQMAVFSRWLTLIIVLLATGIFGYGLWRHDYPVNEIFMAAVSIAISAIPEGLPAIMTITLALGVQNMARRNAIVSRLPAVETLGAVTVICTDKTGTLTRNEMTVQNLIVAGQPVIQVGGTGYVPKGGFYQHGQEIKIADHADLLALCKAGLLCNDAVLRLQDGVWSIQGDPTEAALVTLAGKASLDSDWEHEMLPRLDVIPFESQHRFMATLHRDPAGHRLIYVKGAPEEVLAMCDYQRSQGEDRPIQPDFWHGKIQQISATGQRILAIAVRVCAAKEALINSANEMKCETHGTQRPRPIHEMDKEASTAQPGDSLVQPISQCAPKQQTLAFADVTAGFSLLGMVGIIDPPREEAVTAIKQCRTAGIRVKMITGDHRVTAASIGAIIGIGDGRQVVTGVEMDGMDAAQLRKLVADVDVFARANPEHKLRLVKALQENGEIVAMTGDGVNDAPALKRADIGVAMGRNGTEVAKEAAEMVLTDDNFASIAYAVEEGRAVYDNIRKTVVYILPTSIGGAGILLLAILFGMALPITPVQILWVNMVTTVTLAISLAFERPESNVMVRFPHDPNASILSGFLVWRIGIVALLMIAGGFSLYFWEIVQGGSIESGRTVVVNTLVMCEIFYLFNCRYLIASACSRQGLLGNRYILFAIALLLALQLLFTYWSVMQQLFGTVALDAAAWGRIVAVGLLLFLFIELEKYWMRRSGVKYV
ncbi:MAG: HAD-IC family P-type ATPase [Nitrosomonas sp.]|nr:MAG: HAD-IC family P-type ATPase [Nitrosomonas sp.]